MKHERDMVISLDGNCGMSPYSAKERINASLRLVDFAPTGLP
jgi:hypothetical protein